MDKGYTSITCLNCAGRNNSLFSTFSDNEIRQIDETRSCRDYPKNQELFSEGGIPKGVFCLNRGKVKIYTLGNEGKQQIIHIADAGEIVGFRAMFSGDPYKVSATALEDCRVCFISKEDFMHMIDTNQSLRHSVMRELSRGLGERAILITNMSQKSVRERLASALILLHNIYKEEPINLSREDLANFVGTATETLIRLLKDFKKEGLIDKDIRRLYILQRENLARIAGPLR